jgi:peroxiredoxin
MQDENRSTPVPPDATPSPHGHASPLRGARRRLTAGQAAGLAVGAVMLVAAVVWLAPGVGDDHTPWAGYENPADPDDREAIGKEAPLHFTMPDMHGRDVRLASFKGRVIVLNFWATWCAPCRVEIPDLVAVQAAYGDDLVVLGVSIDDTVDALEPFVEEFQMNYPVLLGLGREDLQDAYGVWGLPVSVVIDRNGVITMKHSGLASREQLESWIAPLI